MKPKGYICDKCGKDIPYYNNSMIAQTHATMKLYHLGQSRCSLPQQIDLCPECYNKFINWLETEVEE